jgi:hypothetical protein
MMLEFKFVAFVMSVVTHAQLWVCVALALQISIKLLMDLQVLIFVSVFMDIMKILQVV